MKISKIRAIIYVIMAAAFYAINDQISKILLEHIGSTTMAALLYLGAGIGMLVLSFVDKSDKGSKLDRQDLPYVIGMIVLDMRLLFY